jgi:polyketide cyclase/dehydrase/lipid transport protein
MPQHRIAASARIPAPAALVYSIIADYRDGHPHILPRPPFGALTVERGGVGAGTAIVFEMRLLGRTQTVRATIAEPEPGRVLVETVAVRGPVTTFTVDPRDEGRQADVTIATDMPVRPGILGAVERWLTTRLLRPVYERELAQLAAFAARRAGE